MGISAFQYGWDRSRALVDKDGVPTRDGRDFLLALFLRGGGNPGVPNVQIGITATGVGQNDALGLIGDWNYVEIVPSGSGVRIPPLAVGADCIIFNASTSVLSVYPSVVAATQGGPVQIDALGANIPYSLPPGRMQWFRQIKPNLLKSTQFGRLPGGTIFVDPVNGSDSNDGRTLATAFQNVLTAWNFLRDQTDGAANIQLAAGATFGPIGELDGDVSGGFGRLVGIVGDPINPPTILVPAGGVGVSLRDGAWVSFGNIKFDTTVDGMGNHATGANGAILTQKSLADFGNISWGAFPGGGHIVATDGADCNIVGTETITGGAGSHWSISAAAKLIIGSVTINGGNGAFNFPFGFLAGNLQARIQTQTIMFVGTGNFTGQPYNLIRHSVATLSPNVLPGNVAGFFDSTSNAY